MSYEKSHERTLESNGLLQNSEKFCDKGCIVENEVCREENSKEGTTEDLKSQPRTSSSCNDLLMFGKSQLLPLSPKDDVMPISASDFSIPYNIINNYFSGACFFLFPRNYFNCLKFLEENNNKNNNISPSTPFSRR